MIKKSEIIEKIRTRKKLLSSCKKIKYDEKITLTSAIEQGIADLEWVLDKRDSK